MTTSAARQEPAAFGIGRLFWLVSEAIVGADLASGTVVLWNPAASRLFGYDEDEAIGMALEALVPEELRHRHLEGIRRFSETRQGDLVGGHPVDVPALRKDGSTFDASLTLTDASPNDDACFVVAIVRDISEVTEASRQLERSATVMREFVATASHDLRTPLASVLGFARLLLDGDLSPEEIRTFAETIHRNAERASRLVDDLLTLSQIQADAVLARPAVVSVAEVLQNAMSEAAIDVVLDVPEGATVWADVHHFERILENYLVNAKRYGEPPVRVHVRETPAGVEVRVCDSGEGVPRDFVDRLFTSFSRADPSLSTGTGLGLSIVRGLAQANGGDAFYEPGEGGGSCFGVLLPAAPR